MFSLCMFASGTGQAVSGEFQDALQAVLQRQPNNMYDILKLALARR